MKNKKPLISIIMNCYNGDTYLRESINSVIEQTFNSWELIFWDNRSEDKSAEVFKTIQNASDFGLSVEGANFDFSKVMKRSRGVADTMGGGIEFLFKKNKVESVSYTHLTLPTKRIV